MGAGARCKQNVPHLQPMLTQWPLFPGKQFSYSAFQHDMHYSLHCPIPSPVYFIDLLFLTFHPNLLLCPRTPPKQAMPANPRSTFRMVIWRMKVDAHLSYCSWIKPSHQSHPQLCIGEPAVVFLSSLTPSPWYHKDLFPNIPSANSSLYPILQQQQGGELQWEQTSQEKQKQPPTPESTTFKPTLRAFQKTR